MAANLLGLLDICIITYNRATYLDRTLNWLLSSKLSTARIFVLDNCSSDDTPAVCEKYQSTHRNLNIIRNRINVGTIGNEAAAIQIATARYLWILCDDDILMFDDCDELIEELAKGSSDLIIAAAPGDLQIAWGKRSTFDERFLSDPKVLKAMSFLPSTIFRTSLIDANVMHRYYSVSHSLFPHLSIATSLFHRNVSVYSLNKPLVRQYCADAYWWTSIEMASNWVQTCHRLVRDPVYLSKAIYEVPSRVKKSGPVGFSMRTAVAIVVSKAQRRYIKESDFPYRESVFESLCHIFLGCVRGQKWIVALCSPLLLVPQSVCVQAIRAYNWIMYSARGKPVPGWIPGNVKIEPEAMRRESAEACLVGNEYEVQE